MSSRTNNGSSTAVAADPAASKRFELPALNFKFGSLTEGTSIPPPLPSPIVEEPNTPEPEPPKRHIVAGVAQGLPDPTKGATITSTATAGNTRKGADAVPSSPTTSTRSSLRRYLSRSLLHPTYEEEATPNGHGIPRPASRVDSVFDERKAKRTSGWFRRFKTSDTASKRSSQLSFESVDKAHLEPAGPPPPKIPELSQWKAQVDTSMGDDLFKGIR